MSRRRQEPRVTSWAHRAATLCCFLAVAAGAVTIPSAPASAYTTVVYSGRGPNVPRISVIGDSVGSGIRWTNSYAPLTRFNFTFDAESCRRTIAPSCGGREGYAPENVLQTMRRLDGRLGEVLVLMTGYNDAGIHFGAGVDAVMAEAARQGVPKVIWLTMRTAGVTYASPGFISTSSTFRDNNKILLQKAQQYRGALQVADWATFSASQPSWVGSDGVHLSVRGAPIAAQFIADMAGLVLDGVTITPPAATKEAPVTTSPLPGWLSTFAVGTDNNLWQTTYDGQAWRGYVNLGGPIGSAPAAVSRGPGLVDVFMRGDDYALWTNSYDGVSWSGWRSLGGVLRSPPAVTTRGGSIEVFAVGGDRALWTINFDGNGWGPWWSLGGRITGQPAAVSPDSETVTVVALGDDGALWTRTWHATWGAWTGLGGHLVSAPAVALPDPLTLTVVARGADNALWTRTWHGTWGGWASLGGQVVSAPAAASNRPGTIDVYAQGLDNALWTVRYDGGWRWSSLGGRLSGPPAATAFLPGATAVFTRGTDGALWGRTDSDWFHGWYGLGGRLR